MPRVCIVPGCGRNDKNAQYSLFSFPKDEELKSKWIKAIPGITSLGLASFICEKHFLKQYIIKEFIQRDVYGNVIAKSILQRRRLRKNAVPTIFKSPDMPSLVAENNTEAAAEEARAINSSGINSLKSGEQDTMKQFQPSITRKAALNQTGGENTILQVINTENVKNTVVHNNNNKGNENNLNSTLEDSPKIEVLHSFILNSQTNKNDTNVRILRRVPKAHMRKIMAQKKFLNIVNIGNNMFKLSDTKVNNVIRPANEAEVKERSSIMINDVNNDQNVSKTLSKTYAVEHDYALHGSPRPISCTNAVVNIDPKNLELPKSWGVTEKTIQNKKYLLFTRVITRNVNQQEVEVLQKYMLLDCTEKSASYFIYGHQVKDITTLPEVIHSTDILLRCLSVFGAMRVCEGLGPVDSSLIRTSESVMRDSLNSLRHAKCTWMLKRTKMCEFCKKLNRLVSTRSLQSHKIACNGTVSKDMFYNLKRKLVRERRQKELAIEQKNMMLKELDEKTKQLELSLYNGASFKNICLQHLVRNNQRITLKEILDNSKTKPQGRRYSQEWLMFCISLSTRSPTTYEFLRKTNVIPLPGLRTIRKYFYGKKPKGHFDKAFIDLVRSYQEKNSQPEPENVLYPNLSGNVFDSVER